MRAKEERKRIMVRLAPATFEAAKKLAQGKRRPLSTILAELITASLIPAKDESVKHIVNGAANRVIHRLADLEGFVAEVREILGVSLRVACRYLPQRSEPGKDADAESVLARARFAKLVDTVRRNALDGRSVFDEFAESAQDELPGAGEEDSMRADQRDLSMLEVLCGPMINEALGRDDVTDLWINPDGRVCVEDHAGRRSVGEMAAAKVEAIIRFVASIAGRMVTPESPSLNTVLPCGARFQGNLPPDVPAPSIVIRKHAPRVWDLAEHVAMGTLSTRARDFIEACVEQRLNLMFCGATGSGKTTLLNAALACPVLRDERIITIEDTLELRCGARDVLSLVTSPGRCMNDLVRDAMRLYPDRLAIGEVRGAEALSMVKGLVTGHRGFATMHAESIPDALQRLEDLTAEAVLTVPRRTIASAIHVVVHMTRIPTRRVVDIARIRGLDDNGQYRIEAVKI